jgi:hypothetical protein
MNAKTPTTAPRVRTLVNGRHIAQYSYKGRDISISRKDESDNWYIMVTEPSGDYAYNGLWSNSAGKSKREAVLEAISGACINEPSA